MSNKKNKQKCYCTEYQHTHNVDTIWPAILSILSPPMKKVPKQAKAGLCVFMSKVQSD